MPGVHLLLARPCSLAAATRVLFRANATERIGPGKPLKVFRWRHAWQSHRSTWPLQRESLGSPLGPPLARRLPVLDQAIVYEPRVRGNAAISFRLATSQIWT